MKENTCLVYKDKDVRIVNCSTAIRLRHKEMCSFSPFTFPAHEILNG